MDAQRNRRSLPLLLSALFVIGMIAGGCRAPVLPVFHRERLAIIYDSAHEHELRSGRPLRFGLDGMERYVDTLSEPVAITSWQPDHCDWDIFVATNRGLFDALDDPVAANRVMADVHYGHCRVTLPRNDAGMQLQEQANRKKSQPTSMASESAVSAVSAASAAAVTRPDTAVEKTRLSTTEFLDSVNRRIRQSRQKDLLLFVHGFNVSFDDAVSRTAELGLKIPFNGVLVAYSWPTLGGTLNYSRDEPVNKSSVQPFTNFLTTLREGVPQETQIHLLVHSMGNRIVMESLFRLPEPRSRKPFGHVVLCAPDVGVGEFEEWAPGVVRQAHRVTLYANSSDTALIASKGLHRERRAGDAEDPLIVSGIETIDCSRIDQTLMGHSYYVDNRDVTTDLFMLLKEDLPPEQRHFLEQKKSADGIYWQFARHAPTIMCTWHFDELHESH